MQFLKPLFLFLNTPCELSTTGFPFKTGAFREKYCCYQSLLQKNDDHNLIQQQFDMQKQVLRSNDHSPNRRKNIKGTLHALSKGKRNKSKPESKRKYGYWRNSQQQKYLIFLQDNYMIMQNAQLRSEFQIFKRMSKYIRSRDPVQCKSHHQKMLMKNKNSLECIMGKQNTSEITRPEYLYRQQFHDGLVRDHLDKIETNQERPYFMIQEAKRLLIVIDQRFMISY